MPTGGWEKLLVDILETWVSKSCCLPHLTPCPWSSSIEAGGPREGGSTVPVVAWTSNPEMTGPDGAAVWMEGLRTGNMVGWKLGGGEKEQESLNEPKWRDKAFWVSSQTTGRWVRFGGNRYEEQCGHGPTLSQSNPVWAMVSQQAVKLWSCHRGGWAAQKPGSSVGALELMSTYNLIDRFQ